MTNISTLHDKATALINQGLFIEAHPLLVQIIKLEPNHADSYFLLGIISLELGQVRKSIQLIEKALSFQQSTEYYAHLAKAYSLIGNLKQASYIAEFAPATKIDNALTLDTFGVALSRVGLHDAAIKYFSKAIAIDKSQASYYYNYAVSNKFIGQFDVARKSFEMAIQIDPNYYQAHFALSDLGGTDINKNHITRLENTLESCVPTDGKLHLCHALAKEYESIKDFSKAFYYLEKGKNNKLSTLDYNFENDQKLFNKVIELSEENKHPSSAGFSNKEPIFVLGMPRSGTTLVERIISNHSDVTSAGELQDFGVAIKELSKTSSRNVLDIETLTQAYKIDPAKIGERYIERTRVITGKTKHFIDKLPFNFYYIDLIQRALPNAKIVCLLRNPMDTCIGNYRQLFSINSPYYFYAYSLISASKFYAGFYSVAKYWEQRSPNNFKLLEYEKLVENPESMVKELIDFCDLPWQEKCLHVEKNDAPVSTASKVQVREPINNKSIGRWKNYAEQMLHIKRYFIENGIIS